MEHAQLLSGWESFYVIIGSSAAALTGLQFVVMTLIDADKQVRSSAAEVRAFGTPTVVHFCAVLLISAISSAPWHELSGVASAFVVCGVLGVLYGGLIIRRALNAPNYKPVLEDWIWHAALPLLAYGALLVAALTLPQRPATSLFVVGAAALLLLLVGIHNAWDTVTYLAIDRARKQEDLDQ
jgi:hypothetical protein